MSRTRYESSPSGHNYTDSGAHYTTPENLQLQTENRLTTLENHNQALKQKVEEQGKRISSLEDFVKRFKWTIWLLSILLAAIIWIIDHFDLLSKITK